MKAIRSILLALGLAAAALPVESSASQPNILVILTDDQGYGDLSLHGNQHLETPRLDQLGEQSLRFTNYFVHTVCAPTRASLMTGKHFNRVSVWGVHEGREHLIRSVKTLPECLKDAGYHTAMVGKWHLGSNPGHLPWQRGFDDALTGTNYKNHVPVYHVRSAQGPVELKGASTQDILTREALAMLDRRPTNKPFFLYVAYNSPHGPWVGPEELVEKYMAAGLARETANCYAEIESMDRAIGNLLDGVAERDLADDTIVVFFSDNGPDQAGIPDEDWVGRNPHGFRGQKGRQFDNGHRVALFVRMPGQKSREVPAVTNIADLMPTFLDFAGLPVTQWPEDMEGRSIRPLLDGSGTWPNRRFVDTTFNPNWDASGLNREPDLETILFENQGLWIRDERFKFIQTQQGQHMLFDTLEDPKETTNIMSQHRDLADSFLKDLRIWWQETLEFPETFVKGDRIIGFEGEETTIIKTVTFPEWRGNIGGWFRHEGFDEDGDGFAGNVTVAMPGTYDVFMHCGHEGTKLDFRLTIGGSVLEDSLQLRRGDLKLGTISLSETGVMPLEFVLTDTASGQIPDLYFMTFQLR